MKKKVDPLSPRSIVLLLLLAVGLGSYYRLMDLGSRPMHTDEAILATKLGGLWTGQGFQYDPSDYHGPGFHYAGWAYGKLAGWGDPQTWTEPGLRHVTVACGLAVMACSLLLLGALGTRGALLSMLLVAVSPMMVYYSRYFIMEMLLVLLVAVSLIALWRWSISGNRLWLVLCGASLGLQHATKETFVLNVAAASGAWLAAHFLIRQQGSSSLQLSSGYRRKRPQRWWPYLLFPALVVSVVCYSAFFSDWVAVKESFTTYGNYLQRSEGSGHEKPWHYYITLIFWRKDGLAWTEALIGGLGLIGMAYAFLGDHRDSRRQRFLVFLSLYTLLLFGVYSFLAYKTPWSILSAQHSLTLLAGVGGAALRNLFVGRIARLAYTVALGFGIYHLCDECKLAIGPYKADPRNPYVYSHTSTNLLKLVETVHTLQRLSPEQPLTIQVINRDHGWPLPWYFRDLPKTGFQTIVPSQLNADIIIADAELGEIVMDKVFAPAYRETGLHGLRPGIPLIMLVKNEPWERLLESRRQSQEVESDSSRSAEQP